MSEKTITDGLFALKDENYRRFHPSKESGPATPVSAIP